MAIVLVIGAFIDVGTICDVLQLVPRVARAVVSTQYISTYLIALAEILCTFIQI